MSSSRGAKLILHQAYNRALAEDGSYITLVGDLMVDQWVRGRVTRMSPEQDDCPVLLEEECWYSLGGAGLVFKHLKAMGLPLVKFVTMKGYDYTDLIKDQLLDIAGGYVVIAQDPGRPTTVKTRIIVAPNNHLVRVDREEARPIDEMMEQRLDEILVRAIKRDCKLVVVSDYNKGLITPHTMDVIRERCRAIESPFIVDPPARDFGVFTGAKLITPNMEEFAAAKHDPAFYDIEWTCETLGDQGLRFYDHSSYASRKPPLVVKSLATEARDAVGAGDMVIAAAAVFLAGGAPMPLAIQMANALAGWFVSQDGPVSPEPDTVRALIDLHAPNFV